MTGFCHYVDVFTDLFAYAIHCPNKFILIDKYYLNVWKYFLSKILFQN